MTDINNPQDLFTNPIFRIGFHIAGIETRATEIKNFLLLRVLAEPLKRNEAKILAEELHTIHRKLEELQAQLENDNNKPKNSSNGQ